jgi:hypothetical protein
MVAIASTEIPVIESMVITAISWLSGTEKDELGPMPTRWRVLPGPPTRIGQRAAHRVARQNLAVDDRHDRGAQEYEQDVQPRQVQVRRRDDGEAHFGDSSDGASERRFGTGLLSGTQRQSSSPWHRPHNHQTHCDRFLTVSFRPTAHPPTWQRSAGGRRGS